MHCIICDIPVILSEKLAYTSYYSKVLTLIGHIIETMVATGFQLGMDIFLNIPNIHTDEFMLPSLPVWVWWLITARCYD